MHTQTDVDRGAFSINGLEFDLDELERFKTKLAAKRAASSAKVPDDGGVDELDDYLDRLALDVADKTANQPPPPPSQFRSNSLDVVHATAFSTPTIVDANVVDTTSIDEPEQHQQQSLPMLLYFALGLLFFVSTVTASLPSNSSRTNLGCKRAHRRAESY